MYYKCEKINSYETVIISTKVVNDVTGMASIIY